MAAQAWTVYNRAKEYIGDNTIDMDDAIFKMALFKSTSNAATLTLLSLAQVTDEVNASWGYTTGGKTCSAHTWQSGTSAKATQFDHTAVFWSANGGTITSIQFAVIYQSGGANELLCFSSLSSAIFAVTDTNRLTVTPHDGSGVFEMV